MHSYIIGDASFIGLECPTGIVDDCNDGTDESVPNECAGILMVPETETKCGSQCRLPEIITTKQPDVTSPIDLREDRKLKIDDDEEVKDAAEEGFLKFWSFYTNKVSKIIRPFLDLEKFMCLRIFNFRIFIFEA